MKVPDKREACPLPTVPPSQTQMHGEASLEIIRQPALRHCQPRLRDVCLTALGNTLVLRSFLPRLIDLEWGRH